MELLDKLVECLLKKVKTPDLQVADYPTGLESRITS